MIETAERTIIRVVVTNPWRMEDPASRVIDYPAWTEGVVADYLPASEVEYGPDDVLVTLNGVPVDGDEWGTTPVAAGECVTVIPRIGEAVTVVYAVVQVAIIIAGVLVAADQAKRAKIQAHHAARRASRRAAMMDGSAVYGWNGVQNTTEPGRSIPILLGEHRVGGQIVYAEPREGLSTKLLDMVILISQGEVAGPKGGNLTADAAGMQINGATPSDYPGITIDHRVGSPTQTAMAKILPTKVPRNTTVNGKTLAIGVAETYTMQADRSAVTFTFKLPNGIWYTNPPSYVSWWNFKANLRARWRTYPGGAFGSWTNFSSGWIAGQHNLYTGGFAYTKPAQFQWKSPDLTSGHYEFEVELLSYSNVTSSAGWTFTVDTTNTRVVFAEASEFFEPLMRYPTRALVGVTALASEKLGGVPPTITAIWQGLLLRQYTQVPGATLVSSSSGATNSGAGSNAFSDGTVNFTTLGVKPGDLVTITDAGTGSSSNEGTFYVVTVPTTTSLVLQTVGQADPGFDNGTGVTYTIQSTTGVYSTAFTRNPAWQILNILADTDWGGGGDLVWHQDFDIQSFIDSADFCDGLVSRGVTDPIVGESANGRNRPGDASNIFRVDSSNPSRFDNVKVDDTLVIDDTSLAGSYRIDAILNSSTLRCSTTAGADPGWSNASGATWSINGTERRFLSDFYIDDQTDMWAAANAIAKNARCAILWVNGKLYLRPDESTSVVAVISSDLIVPGSFRREYIGTVQAANILEGQFLNAEKDYEQDVVRYEDPAVFTNSETHNPQRIEMFGKTRQTDAIRTVKYQALSNRYERKAIAFKIPTTGLALIWGDRIRLGSDILPHETIEQGADLWPSAVVVSATATTVTFDRDVYLDANYSRVTIQDQDDDSITTVTFNSLTGWTRTLTVGSWPDFTPAEGDIAVLTVLYGDSTTPYDFKIVEIVDDGDGTRELKCVPFNTNLYTEADDPDTAPTFDVT